jgi:hypothetical protein
VDVAEDRAVHRLGYLPALNGHWHCIPLSEFPGMKAAFFCRLPSRWGLAAYLAQCELNKLAASLTAVVPSVPIRLAT